jgi:alpha-glucoside transport system substrate-binding protein
MRMARVRTGFLAMVGTLALVAAACGGGGGGGTTTPSGGAKTSGPDLSGQTVEVAAVWTGPEQKSFEQVLNAFQDKTGATAKFTSTGDDIATVLGTRLQGGKPPDVAILPQPGLLKQYADEGRLQQLDNVVGPVMDQNFAPVWQDFATVDGKLFGAYWKASNKSTFWFNKHVFDDAGVQPPTNYPGLLQTAQTVSDSGVTPFAMCGASGWTLTDWFENIYLRSAGPDKYDQLTTHDVKWTDPSVIEGLKLFQQVISKQDFIVGGTTGALQTDFPTCVDQVYSDPPKGGMVYEADFVAAEITGATSAKLGTDADFFNFPSVNGSPTAVVSGGDVAVLFKDSEAGKELIKFLVTPEAGEIWAKLGGYTSPNKNIPLSAYPDDITRRSAQALVQAGNNVRFDMSDQEPAEFGATEGQGEWKIFQDFLQNPSDVDGTAKALEAAAAKAFKSE